jgi:hypothetical protein
MSQGFETKSADRVQNAREERKSKEIADIGSIQQSLVEHFGDIKDPRVEPLSSLLMQWGHKPKLPNRLLLKKLIMS